MKYLMIITASLALAACSSTEENNLAADEVGYECEKVYATGSAIPKKMCTTRAQREKRKQDLEDFKNEANRPVATCQIENCGG